MSENETPGVMQCTCMRPNLTNEDDFCRGCRGYVVPERADALRRATKEVAEHRHAAAPSEARSRGTVVDMIAGRSTETRIVDDPDKPAPRVVPPHMPGRLTLHESGNASPFARVSPRQLAAIAAAIAQPETPTLVHDVGCLYAVSMQHGGSGVMTPGCKACDYAAHRIARAGLGMEATEAHEASQLRHDVRNVMTARELHEAANLAEQGIALPGTNAARLIETAEREGDFERSKHLRASIVEWAPTIRAAAVAKENIDRQALADEVRAAVVNLSAIEKARRKRERKGARNRAIDANMRHGARDGGQ